MNIPKSTAFFVQEMRRRNYRPNTVSNYLSNINAFLVYFKEKEHPKHVNETDIANYLATFKCNNTQRSHHGAIKLFYQICVRQPQKFKHIPYARKTTKLPIVLSVQEVQRMFDVCENLKHKAILAMLYTTGMRVGELLNLQWSHLDRQRGIINILDGKGGKDRQVPLPHQLIDVLEKYYRAYKTDTYVFAGQFKNQYSEKSVLEVMKQLARKAGINKRVYTHLMRHNTFTHMVEAGTDINLIQRLAGHGSVKTTNIYVQTSHNLISNLKTPISEIRL